MKHLKLPLILCIAAFAACSKNEYSYSPNITKVVDTSYVYPQLKLLGQWVRISTGDSLTINKDYIIWNKEQPIRYIAAIDTIYTVYNENNVLPAYEYKFNDGFDILTLQFTSPGNIPWVLYKIK